MRAYTPYEAGVGFLDFVIKVYFAKTHPRFPEGGKMTQHMEAMKIGDTLDFKVTSIPDSPPSLAPTLPLPHHPSYPSSPLRPSPLSPLAPHPPPHLP